jgi:hypothetical protein
MSFEINVIFFNFYYLKAIEQITNQIGKLAELFKEKRKLFQRMKIISFIIMITVILSLLKRERECIENVILQTFPIAYLAVSGLKKATNGRILS